MATFLILAASLAGCGRPADAPPLITSGSELKDTLDQARTLSEPALEKSDSGAELGDNDRKRLKDAALLVEGVIGYKPDNFGAQFLAGKIYLALGEHESAAEKLKQSILLVPKDTDVEELRRTLAEGYRLFAIANERMGAYEKAADSAQQAIALYPENPDFRAALASSQIQLGRLTEAKFQISKALTVDPEHRQSLQLEILIEAASKKPSK